MTTLKVGDPVIVTHPHAFSIYATEHKGLVGIITRINTPTEGYPPSVFLDTDTAGFYYLDELELAIPVAKTHR